MDRDQLTLQQQAQAAARSRSDQEMALQRNAQVIERQKQLFDQHFAGTGQAIGSQQWAFDAEQKAVDGSFNRWHQAAKLRIEWMRALAEVRMKLAKENLVRWEAEKEKDADAVRDRIINQLGNDLDHAAAESRRLRRRQKQIETKAKHLRLGVTAGHRLSKAGKSRFWTAFSFFMMKAGGAYIASLASSGRVELLQLVDRYRRRCELPRFGSGDYMAMAEAVKFLELFPERFLAALKKEINAVRDGVHSVWDLPELLQQAGTKRNMSF